MFAKICDEKSKKALLWTINIESYLVLPLFLFVRNGCKQQAGDKSLGHHSLHHNRYFVPAETVPSGAMRLEHDGSLHYGD